LLWPWFYRRSPSLPLSRITIPTASFHADEAFEVLQATLWRNLKEQLLGPNGAKYWTTGMKDAELPGGVAGIEMFEGTLIAAAPADHPNEFMVAIGDSAIPEAKLIMREHLVKPIPIGSPVTFKGIASAYSTDPYLLTLRVEGVNRLTEEAAQKMKRAPPRQEKH